jgi:serine protease
VVQLPLDTTAAMAIEMARRLESQDAGVERVERDHLMHPHAETVPAPVTAAAPGTADTFAHHQWPLMAREPGRTGRANFHRAWNRTAGSETIVVAVLDSGTTHHPDTVSRELAGFDLVTDVTLSADGSERDADPTDPGNFCAAGNVESDWHGTAAAGLIGAIAGNGYGVAGAAPGAWLQHVRVLGRCGAWSSDVADAIVWAAGGDVPGLPRNAMPARVINLSLGAPVDTCASFMQQAVDKAVRLGAVVVASAGNDDRAGIDMPANCRGAISVAAGTESGDLAGYSNHSPAIALTAPAGGLCKTQRSTCIPDGTATVGTVGPTLFEQHAEVRYFGGTSAAAPHVAAAAALVLSANPALEPAQVAAILRATAHREYPQDSFCAGGPRCGAGFLDAEAAVAAAGGAIPSVGQPPPAPAPRPAASQAPEAAVAAVPEDDDPAGGGGAMSLGWLALLALAGALLRPASAARAPRRRST